jgi:hypothetical protein
LAIHLEERVQHVVRTVAARAFLGPDSVAYPLRSNVSDLNRTLQRFKTQTRLKN